ncbi:MAG TPA: hypothetical protein VJN88_14390 [Ktedonobacterales bacterium]|nr:hypothetical protein [Ktedonobacterales bacterium]
MHEVKHLIVTFAEIVIVVLLAVFAVGNIRTARYNFAGSSFAGNVWWTVAGSALLGFLFAALLMGPGRVSRGRGLGRQQEQNAQELTGLRRENERLRGQHAQAVSERDQYRAALASATTTNQAAASNYTAAENTTADEQQRADTTLVNTPADQPATAPDGGWRGAFRLRRANAERDETQLPDSTAAPTA